MFSNLRIRKFSKTIGFKIAAGYSVLFACSFVALTMSAYLLLDSTLYGKDREMVAVEVENLQRRYQSGGWQAFYDQAIENDRFKKNNPFFTRALATPTREEVIFFPHYWKDFDLAALEDMPGQVPGTWVELASHARIGTLEIFTARLPDGNLFQVGISTEDRRTILNHFRHIFLSVSLPLILLAIGGGALLSHRSMQPLRNLIVTMTSIEAGKMDARVPVAHTGDELADLGMLFNRMIEKINQLILAIKGSLDSVAHDLRTPMTRFRNIAETTLQKEQSPAAYREALQECVEESDRILNKLHMLMDISEAETGTMRLQLRHVDLVQLAEGVVDMYRYVAEEKGIRIETDFVSEATLEADADRICQALANLLDNAVKFTPENGSILVSIDHQQDRVRMQVADSGVGIDGGEIHRIWDRLYRGTHATHKGLGLGLSLVRAVILAHSGVVHVSSEPGAGSTFEVCLPTAVSPTSADHPGRPKPAWPDEKGSPVGTNRQLP